MQTTVNSDFVQITFPKNNTFNKQNKGLTTSVSPFYSRE